MIQKFLVSISLLGLSVVSVAGTFYVDRNHPIANDSNSGAEAFPWKTMVHAADVAVAGDTVLIKAGIYEDGDVVVGHSGALGQEIVFAAYPGDERLAVIKGAAFRSYGKSHLRVRGLKVLESPNYGFRFEGPADSSEPPAENIIISNVHTYDTCSSGIAVWGVRWKSDPGNYNNIRDVVIENSLLELGTHGCKNEIITVANGAVNVTVRFNEIRLGDPAMEGGDEGIDFKEGVRDSQIYGNYIHHLSDKAIYIDGGSDPHKPLVSNIRIYDNIMMHLPSAGIVVTTEGVGSVRDVYVYNNIVAHVDGDGFRVYDHPGGRADGGEVNNVYFVNNTATDTGRERGGGFRVNHERATGIVFRNNIAWNNRSYDIRGEKETLIESNLCIGELCSVQEPPGFLDAENDNYRLTETSPAIDVGRFEGVPELDITGVSHSQGLGPDLGAYEFRVPELVTDTEAPAVAIAAPVEGTLSGVINVVVEASDDVEVAQVEFYLNGEFVSKDLDAPYEFVWDSGSRKGQAVELEVRALDEAGNMGQHAVSVTVARAPDVRVAAQEWYDKHKIGAFFAKHRRGSSRIFRMRFLRWFIKHQQQLQLIDAASKTS